MANSPNLILIGMPGVGKSTIGVRLAKRLGVSFLDTDILMQTGLAMLENRLGNLDERGVLRMPGQTIGMLYEERRRLYERYADITVSTGGMIPDRVVTAVLGR